MPYLLDGNNLIGAVRRTSRPTDDDRRALVAEIAGRLRRTRARATIFFDGPAGERPTSLGPLSVRVASGESADDAIVAQVSGSRMPGEAIVVTADRGLAARVRDAGGRVLAPEAFFARVGAGGAPPPSEKDDRVDLEEWKRYFADERNRDEPGR
ncbi:MAG: NYN domain-containing protein [Syntrophomonadaceae bacterium]